MLKTRHVICGALAVITFVNMSCKSSSPNVEPVYDGITLSAWLKRLDLITHAMDEEEAGVNVDHVKMDHLSREIEQAVRSAGTNSIPTLMRLIIVPSDGWKADYGFSVLGPTAKCAVPGLIKLLQDNNSDIRQAAANALGSIGTNAVDAIPDLVKCVYDDNVNVQIKARHALGDIHAQPVLVVPVLVESLSESHKTNDSYMASIIALGEFGGEAKIAIPALLPFLSDTNLAVRAFASTALKSIDPEMAARGGVK